MGYDCVNVSQCVTYGTVRRMDGEGDLAEELHSVERVWERIYEVLCSRPVSVDNTTKQTLDRAMSLEY
jgi:hypothetical protein